MFEEVTPVLGIRRCKKACIGEVPRPAPPLPRGPHSQRMVLYILQKLLCKYKQIYIPPPPSHEG